MIKCTVSILAHNNLRLTERCLETVLETNDNREVELILTDNASTDGTREFFITLEKKFANVRLVHNGENLGFIEPNRVALAMAQGEYFVMLNNDTEVPPDWLKWLVFPFILDPRCALSGPEGGCTELDATGHGHYGPKLEYLEGSCLMGRTELLRQHGLFADYLHFAYCEDSDLSLRMRALGYTLHEARLPGYLHHHFGTARHVPEVKQHFIENHEAFCKVWAHYLKTRRFN